jgi:hypothetical protein
MTPLITLSDLSLMVFGRRHASAYNFSSITRSNGAWAVVMCSIQQFGTVWKVRLLTVGKAASVLFASVVMRLITYPTFWVSVDNFD